jgi:hypothetical protein
VVTVEELVVIPIVGAVADLRWICSFDADTRFNK